MSAMDEVTWDELRKELIPPEDEPLIEEQRRRLIARQRAYELVEPFKTSRRRRNGPRWGRGRRSPASSPGG
ncbi:hypothetical protein GCM10010439_17090 [Actinocorallia aurantiaca]|uniref:Uncharacterized protein n=1 Tax=Actinocorallia aurantiaca TaxID=46204 RepID=A0ABP6GFY5_9ACTN